MSVDGNFDEILASYIPWLHWKAKGFPAFPEDDLVQEALVAMWKELVKRPDDCPIPMDYVMKRRATWKMQDIAKGKPWLQEKDYKRHTGLRHSPVFMSPLSDPDGMIDYTSPLERAAVLHGHSQLRDSAYEAAEFSMYRDEIWEAINTEFTPRQAEYMAVRYVSNAKNSEIVEHFGYEAHALVTKKHKEKLQQSLAHLESLVK